LERRKVNHSNRKRFTFILLFVLMPCIAFDPGATKKRGHGINANIPLYEDSLGWTIWSAKSGVELVDWYTTGKFRAFEAGIHIDFSAFEHMTDEPEKYIGFALKIPDDLFTFWSKNSAVHMTYVLKGDTCAVKSEEFLVQRLSQPGTLTRSGDIRGFVIVGGERCDIFTTPNGNPVLFFKFPIKQTPEMIIRCRVEHVIAKGGTR